MRLVQRPIKPKVKDMVIGLKKPKIFSKNPWECKKYEGMKWVEDAPRNETSGGCPRNKMGQGCPKE